MRIKYVMHYAWAILPCRAKTTLEDARRGHRFAADEVKEAVHDWLRSQPQTFFSNSIKKLTDRWAKCIEKKGDYIEK